MNWLYLVSGTGHLPYVRFIFGSSQKASTFVCLTNPLSSIPPTVVLNREKEVLSLNTFESSIYFIWFVNFLFVYKRVPIGLAVELGTASCFND